jgi:hypothetical protein
VHSLEVSLSLSISLLSLIPLPLLSSPLLLLPFPFRHYDVEYTYGNLNQPTFNMKIAEEAGLF